MKFSIDDYTIILTHYLCDDEMQICLYSTGEPRVPDYIRKIYELPNTETPVEIKISEDMSIKVSSLRAYMTKEYYNKVKDMKIVFKDGNKMKLKDSEKNYSLFQECVYLDRVEADFGKPIDLSNIDYILINVKKFEV